MFVWKQVWNNRGILILLTLWRKAKQWHKKFCIQRRPKNSIITKRKGGVLYKKLFLSILQYSQENTCVGVFFKTLLKKETPTQVFSGQYREIFKKSYFEEHLWTAASESFYFYVSLNVFLHEQIT